MIHFDAKRMRKLVSQDNFLKHTYKRKVVEASVSNHKRTDEEILELLFVWHVRNDEDYERAYAEIKV